MLELILIKIPLVHLNKNSDRTQWHRVQFTHTHTHRKKQQKQQPILCVTAPRDSDAIFEKY